MISKTKAKGLYYTYELTFNEIAAKVSYETSSSIVKRIRPHLEAVYRARQTGDVAMASRAINKIMGIVQSANGRFSANTLRGLSDLSLFANRSRLKLNLSDEQKEIIKDRGRRRERATEQVRRARQTPMLEAVSARTPTQVNAQLKRSLRVGVENMYRQSDDGLARHQLESALRLYQARQTTVHNTQAVHVVQQAQQEAGQEIADQYMYLTEGDDRVDDICRPHHGKIYDYNSRGPVPPLHYNCRCWIEPANKDTKPVLDEIKKGNEFDKWFAQNRERIAKEAIGSNPFKHLKPGRKLSKASLKRGARVFKNNKARTEGLLRAVKDRGRWASNKSFINTKGILNDKQARRTLEQRSMLLTGEKIKIPRIRRKTPPSKPLSRAASETVYNSQST